MECLAGEVWILVLIVCPNPAKLFLSTKDTKPYGLTQLAGPTALKECPAGMSISHFNDLLCAGLGHEYKHPGDVGSSAGILCHVFLLPA